MSTILLANAYYDIRTGTPFTPYIGGGLGFAVNQLTRNPASRPIAVRPADFSVERPHHARAISPPPPWPASPTTSTRFSSIDVNYRFLYIGGTDVDLVLNGVNSDVAIGDISEHQIRAGFRFYIELRLARVRPASGGPRRRFAFARARSRPCAAAGS